MTAAAANVIQLRPEPAPLLSTELRRSFDAGDINPILNDPAVFPAISKPGIEKFDVTDVVTNPANVLLMAQGGGIIFWQHQPGVYEVHTNFLPKFRGRHAIRASLAAYRWMFTHTDCTVLVTRVPAFNDAAALFCRLVGATKMFVRHAMWPTVEGMADVTFWSLTYDEWLRRTPAVMESGRAFHAKLDAEFERHGITRAAHPDEDCHDLYVGACVETIYGGQPEKAVALYNGWAQLAEYGCIGLIARNPLIIDIGDALIQVLDHDFKVIKCR
jgi:hypothetical protein